MAKVDPVSRWRWQANLPLRARLEVAKQDGRMEICISFAPFAASSSPRVTAHGVVWKCPLGLCAGKSITPSSSHGWVNGLVVLKNGPAAHNRRSLSVQLRVDVSCRSTTTTACNVFVCVPVCATSGPGRMLLRRLLNEEFQPAVFCFCFLFPALEPRVRTLYSQSSHSG